MDFHFVKVAELDTMAMGSWCIIKYSCSLYFKIITKKQYVKPHLYSFPILPAEKKDAIGKQPKQLLI